MQPVVCCFTTGADVALDAGAIRSRIPSPSPFSYLPDTAGAPRQIPGWDPSINKRKRVGDPRIARRCGGGLGRWDPSPLPSFRVRPPCQPIYECVSFADVRWNLDVIAYRLHLIMGDWLATIRIYLFTEYQHNFIAWGITCA